MTKKPKLNENQTSRPSKKHLYIMRHASASTGIPDKDRTLTFEGRKQLEVLSMKALGLFDEVTHVLCSSATRTRLTCMGLKDILPFRSTYQFLDPLYNASAESIMEEINLLPDEAGDVLVIAHNPGVSQFLNFITPPINLSMGTAQIAIYDIQSSYWHSINFQDCKFREFI